MVRRAVLASSDRGHVEPRETRLLYARTAGAFVQTATMDFPTRQTVNGIREGNAILMTEFP
jgi:hypothetical protein